MGGWTLYQYQWRGSAETTFYWSSDFISGTRHTFIYKWKGERFENNKLNYNWTGDGNEEEEGRSNEALSINVYINSRPACLPACRPTMWRHPQPLHSTLLAIHIFIQEK